MQVIRYSSEKKLEWDAFVDRSKNGTFLFKRNYMDYHSDRFTDCSWMVFNKNKLIAILPANICDSTLYSHQGLTFGGWVTSLDCTIELMLNFSELLFEQLKKNGVKNFVYKCIPYIYNTYPSQEDVYMLFRNRAKLIQCGITSVIDLRKRLPFENIRKRGIKKGIKYNLKVEKSDNIEEYWKLLSNLLSEKYRTKPVHTIDEIQLLASRFPENIELYVVKNCDGAIIGGTLLYISKSVVKSQYIASSKECRDNGGLDLLFSYLLDKYKQSSEHRYFDFGISVENGGLKLNNGLIHQKEGFGGRGVVYETYEIEL